MRQYMTRNTLITVSCCMAVLCCVKSGRSSGRGSGHSQPAAGGSTASRPGFTLVEILTVISIVAVVLVIALPAIGSFIRNSRRTVNLANLHTHSQVIALYAADQNDLLPRPFEIGEPITFFEHPAVGRIPVRYFDAYQYWHLPLLDSYYNSSLDSPAFFPPAYEGEVFEAFGVETPYAYTCTSIASPDYWNQLTRRGGISQWVANRLGNVLFPSDKAIFVQIWPYTVEASRGEQNIRIPLVTADGAALASTPRQRLPGYPRGDGPEEQVHGAVHFGDYPPLLHTIDGIRGRDILRR